MTPTEEHDPRHGPVPDNPFDTGLPMLRTPSKKAVKRRRRPGRRAQIRRREPKAEDTARLAVSYEESARPQFGEWAQWLDTAPSTDMHSHSPAARQASVPIEPTSSAAPQSPKPDNDQSRTPGIVNRSGPHPGAPVRHARRAPDGQRGSRPLLVLIVLGLAVATGSIALTIAYGSDTPAKETTAARTPGGSAPVTATPTVGADSPSAIATPGCAQQRTGDTVSGTAPGGTGNGPDAILAFEYAYYAERSGYRARAVVAPDAAVSTADQIQRGIDLVPLGTRYCVLITAAGQSAEGHARWEVRLTQQFPGEQPSEFTQFITTRTGSDRTLITEIAAG
ncbi:hypothetical protein [Nocardia sp. CNY236]|uniref:hypothetical protein n=1 Tax=Nocardia sp. CNY236 TaxID=1169152 RepID=UPI0006862F77|nr:hypothetical protein [Nocardia sp. CNY236]